MSNSTEKTRRLVGLSIFTALVIVLQLVATFVKIGAFPVTLTLVPIVVGAALYGPKAGAWLGFVFGVVVLIACITNADATGGLLWNLNPFMTALLCIVKGAAAGWVAALVYKALEKTGAVGDETTVLAENTVDEMDARKALARLKLKMRKKEQG